MLEFDSGISRRSVIAAALALGAAAAVARPARRSRVAWRQAPEYFPHGVASGDPQARSVLLWTRWQPPPGSDGTLLTVEVSRDPDFHRVVAGSKVQVSAAADWTCRVLVDGLEPSSTYWYRFTDERGAGSRIGRTRTAPRPGDDVVARFAFVSCQNANLGPLTPWRRMIFDDAHQASAKQIEFVLHLGDFAYESVWLAAEMPHGYFDRKIRDIVDYPDGERHEDYHVPTSLRDYRALYHAYLRDPDLQDARARWPFVCIWDNGEYSNLGWQGLQRFGSTTIPAQSRKVAANQAWFEYIPARVRTMDGSLAAFAAPQVSDRPVTSFDEHGLGLEANNLAAISSLIAYRAIRWGRHVELILTDQRSFRSEDYTAAPEAKAIASTSFPQLVPYESLRIIDAGRTWNQGKPPAGLRFAEHDAPNFQRTKPPRTLLGEEQKRWFLGRLRRSNATWKLWGDTVATLDMRADPQNLPLGLTVPWRGEGYAGFARTDHSTAFTERAEIYDCVANNSITGFVTLSGDRHSFWAGYSAKDLPPQSFEPVGLAFVVGSVTSPGFAEALEHSFPREHPLRALYLADTGSGQKPDPAINLLLKHGVRTCLDYAAHGDLEKAKLLSNPGNAPHVEFVDMAGHGFALVEANADAIAVQFVCVPRPVEPTSAPDGGPIRYRVEHRAKLWAAGAAPKLRRSALEGDAGVSA